MTSPLPTELLPGGGVGHSSVKGSVSGPAEGDSGQPLSGYSHTHGTTPGGRPCAGRQGSDARTDELTSVGPFEDSRPGGRATQSVTQSDEHDAEEVGVGGLFPYWPDSERSSSTLSASAPKSLQSRRTLAFWLGPTRDTVSRGALRVLRALVVEPTDPYRYRGIVGDVWAGTSRAS